MGHRVVYLGEPGGVRTNRAAELAPGDIDFGVVSTGISPSEQVVQLADAETIITNGLQLTIKTIEQLPKLRLLQLMSAGFDVLDVPALRELGVEVCNNSPAIANSVAEHAVALMLLVYKRLSPGIDGVREGTWQGPATSGPHGTLYELTGRTVGIVGLGNIGSRVAKRLTGFETKTLYADVMDFPEDYTNGLDVSRVSFDELLSRADVVTAHVPLSSSTRGMFGRREFRAMKSDAIFINTCRGPVQDEAALIAALESGEIAAAGLDVTEVEPTPADSPLLKMDNVVVTPHLAGSSQERVDRALVFSFENARRVMSGELPLNAVRVLD